MACYDTDMATSETPVQREEWEDLLHGLIGGLLFAMPMVYTLEVWHSPYGIPTWKVLLLLVVTFIYDVGLNAAYGFRDVIDWRDALRDSVEAIGIGMGIGLVLPFLLEISNWPLEPVYLLRQTVLLAVPVSIGVSLAGSQLSGQRDRRPRPIHLSRRSPLLVLAKNVGSTVAGSVFLGYTIAPTEEIVLIASRCSIWALLALVTLSLLFTYMISAHVHYLSDQRQGRPDGRPYRDALVAYAVALVVAGLLLWFVGIHQPPFWSRDFLAMTVVLGLPSAVGGAVGRLVL